ncbi:MAG TPA: MBOAT family O-acyltransferase [Pyrinomonadaceae bacterium]|nr:MBOAT family O-acyltransferase [Pyrinomonadaceae bacterium]
MDMTFGSFSFWLFLGVTWILWALSPNLLYRRLVLAGSSLIYYFLVQPATLPLLVTLVVFTYLAGEGIQRASLPRLRQRFLGLGIGMSVSCLVAYKYASSLGRFGARLAELAPGLRDESGRYVLALGISYYTFQAIGYLIDCYRRQSPSDSSLTDYVTYLSFFPHITAGPILRSMDFLPQLRERARMASPVIWTSLVLIIFGLFKKMVIADNLAAVVDQTYSNIAATQPVQLIVASYAYAIQLYCDFSGYTDLAIGTALLFGLSLPENFRWPYLAESIVDFWNRWHISLSHWLRDYVYFSLPGLRSGKLAAHRNLIITMAICGIWHGAGWTFLIWGLYHGVLLVMYRVGQPLWRKLSALPSWLNRLVAIVFVQQLVVMGWVIFRVEKISDLRVFGARLIDFQAYRSAIFTLSPELKGIIYLLAAIWIGQLVHRKVPVTEAMRARHWNPWAMSFLLLIALAIVTFKRSVPVPFIYFKF